jgi:hypothetical protein
MLWIVVLLFVAIAVVSIQVVVELFQESGIFFVGRSSQKRFDLMASSTCKSNGTINGTIGTSSRTSSFLPHLNLTQINTTTTTSNPTSQKPDWFSKCESSNDIFRQHFSSASASTNFLLSSPQNDNITDRKTFLVIGDSLDRFMSQYVCQIWGGTFHGLETRRRPAVCRSNVYNENDIYENNTSRHAIIRHLGYFNILGMHRRCENGGTAERVDPRRFNTTADRLRSLLPRLLEFLPHPPDYVQVGSALWDLSEGCNDQVGVSEAYQQEYILGIHQIYEALTEQLTGILPPNTPIFWRNSPPIRKSYSNQMEELGHGRTRDNQKKMNDLLRHTVTSNNLGQIVDWSSVVQGVSEGFLDQELPDGRHYSKCPSLAFFDAWLNVIHADDESTSSSSSLSSSSSVNNNNNNLPCS